MTIATAKYTQVNNYVPYILSNRAISVKKKGNELGSLFSLLDSRLLAAPNDALLLFVSAYSIVPPPTDGWIFSDFDLDPSNTSSSHLSDFVGTPVTLGSVTTIYPLDATMNLEEATEVKARQEYISLSEALKLEEEIYYTLVARKEAAREVEATYWHFAEED